MIKILLRSLILILIASTPVFADLPGLRNDFANATLAPRNLWATSLSTDDRGRVMISPFGSTSGAVTKTGTKAFGSITNSYTSIVPGGDSLLSCQFFNGTDAPLAFNYNASEDNVFVPAGAQVPINWGAVGRSVSNTINVKYTGSAPTSGSAYVGCFF